VFSILAATNRSEVYINTMGVKDDELSFVELCCRRLGDVCGVLLCDMIGHKMRMAKPLMRKQGKVDFAWQLS
jgi:hypothetical protein